MKIIEINNLTGEIKINQEEKKDYLMKLFVTSFDGFFHYFNSGRYKVKSKHKLDKFNNIDLIEILIYTPDTKEKILIEMILKKNEEKINFDFSKLNKASISELMNIDIKTKFDKEVKKIFKNEIDKIYTNVEKKLGI